MNQRRALEAGAARLWTDEARDHLKIAGKHEPGLNLRLLCSEAHMGAGFPAAGAGEGGPRDRPDMTPIRDLVDIHHCRGPASGRTRCGFRRRAPARMPARPILPSWQAYSNIGPSVRRSGMRAVQGRV